MSRFSRRDFWGMSLVAIPAAHGFDSAVGINGKVAKLDCLIGLVTRMIEEAGVHWWSIYPTTMEDTDIVVVIVVLRMHVKTPPGYQVASEFSFELNTSLETITIRLRDTIRGMDEFIKDEAIQVLPSPRRFSRLSWQKLMRGL